MGLGLKEEASLGAAWIVTVLLTILPEAQAASITGEVRFIGAFPSHPLIQVTKDQDYCGLTLPNESYVIGPSRGLKNAVVYVEKPVPPAPLLEERQRLLENSGCRFSPRVLALRLGEKLIVKNGDPKLHIVHSYADKRTVFNLSLPFRGQSLEATQRLKEAGLLHVKCDTHNWMRAYIHVFDHPFFSVTDERGNFSIADLPPGRYSLKVWHEGAGVQGGEVVVSDQGEVGVNFTFGKPASP